MNNHVRALSFWLASTSRPSCNQTLATSVCITCYGRIAGPSNRTVKASLAAGRGRYTHSRGKVDAQIVGTLNLKGKHLCKEYD